MAQEQKDKKSESTSDFIGPRERLTPVEPPEPEETEISEPEPEPNEPGQATRRQRFKRWYLTHKKLSIPATFLLLLLILVAIPFTRYAVAGVFVSRDIQIQVLDSKTNTPVSEASVQADGASGVTSGTGYVTLHGVDVGPVTVKVTKKYCKDGTLNVTVPVVMSAKTYSTELEPTGRQAKITVKDYVDQEALADVEIKIADIKAKTDQSGEAVVVLPVGPHEHATELTLEGYNTSKVTLTVSDTEIKQNDFKLTPAGKVYFLSNRSGTIDVMKANLDGSEPQVVLAGTGSERASGTVLMASPDWKYLALLARREGSKDKIYIISTADDKLTTADEGSADFTLEGWGGDSLIYTVSRTDLNPWQTGAAKLKAYSAGTGKITTLDQTTGSGDAGSNIHEFYSFVYLSGDTVVYGKGWTSQSDNDADFTGKQETLSAISAGGQNHKVVASADAATKAMDFAPSASNAIYILITTTGTGSEEFLDYQIGTQPQPAEITSEDFYKNYPVYISSPDGKKTLWMEIRDGKTAIMVGNVNGANGKVAVSGDEYSSFGWFTNRYLLLSKDGSELAITGLENDPVQTITSYQADTVYSKQPF